jgi:hypothetical protein
VELCSPCFLVLYTELKGEFNPILMSISQYSWSNFIVIFLSFLDISMVSLSLSIDIYSHEGLIGVTDMPLLPYFKYYHAVLSFYKGLYGYYLCSVSIMIRLSKQMCEIKSDFS